MFRKLLKYITNITLKFKRASCYSEMEYTHRAAFECCSGLAGGDRSTNYLQYQCIGCPYYVELE